MRRGLWVGVVVLLLVGGSGAATGVWARPAAQLASGPPPGVWTLVDFPGVGAVSEPRYTIQFLPTHLVDVLADCNRAGGPWTGGAGTLAITITTSTMAYCPPDSLSQPYLLALDGVSGYTAMEGSLVLHGAAGDMSFTQ